MTMDECDWVNSREVNVDWSHAADTPEAYDEKWAQLIERFESLFQFDDCEDVGAVMIYRRAGEVCGFFDYELLVGYHS